MKSFIQIIVTLSLLTTTSQAATFCFASKDPSQTVFENEALTVTNVSASGQTLLSIEVQVSETDSGSFGHVIKTYSQSNGSKVLQVRFVRQNATALVINNGQSELPFAFNSKLTTALGAACYDAAN